jgi:hypothetical protein
VDHVEAEGKSAQLEAASGGSVAGSEASAGLEESLWLCPIEDRGRLDSSRDGMMQGFSLGTYVKLVDYTGRLYRQRRRRSRRSWPGFLRGSGVALRAGKSEWNGSAGVRCWAVSLRPLARSCGKWPNAWVCDTWSTWRVSQRDDTILNRESRRAAGGPLPCRSMEVSPAIAHISHQFEPGRRNSILRQTKSG